jgi:outer membrane receptor protein involved in Fe transport
MGYRRTHIWAAGLLATTTLAVSAYAQVLPTQHQFDITPRPLKYALREVTRESGLQLFAMTTDLAGRMSAGLHGRMSTQDALDQLLNGTGLSAQIDGGSVFIRGRGVPVADTAETRPDAADIIVTGSRIRGAATASPTITITQADIANSGFSNLGDVVRSIPQNFSGGQNPGVGLTVPVANGENVGSGSSIDLRGIGQDATLTLLNGHRVADGGNRQSVNVSSIPVDAIERIEIVTDGASALYGSDAVAGVANVILKPDYQGLTLTGRWGGATDGGDRQQQYDLTTGRRWSSGGFIIAYEFARETAIQADQRSYTRDVNQGLTLYPAIKHHSVVANGHQAISNSLKFRLDANYDWRADHRGYAIDVGDAAPRYDVRYHSSAFSVAPSLQWHLEHGWQIAFSGTYGQDRSHYDQLLTYGGTTSPALGGCYCNRAASIELKADGALVSLPAGDAKLAIGIGFRRDEMHAYQLVTTDPQNFRVGQSDRYGFAELNIPLVGPQQSVPLISRLNLSVAGRYDDYPGVGRVATPKIGLIYSPTRDIDIKGSWGRSFKAPTLYQRYNLQSASLFNAGDLGGSGYPATATALLLVGGQSKLSPERAESWSTTVDVHPRGVPGLDLSASYFSIRYRDRVVMPIPVLGTSLSDAAYADLVQLSPPAAQQAAAIAGLVFFNDTEGSYDPANVVAIVDDRNINIASQKIDGVDVSLRYSHDMGGGRQFALLASGTWLRSRQQLLPTVMPEELAGTYYNPPHVRSRVGASWSSSTLDVSGFVNYIDGERDMRYGAVRHVSGMATLDLALNYRFRFGSAVLGRMELFAAIQNVTNAKPDQTLSSAVYDAAYDSTNYSPVGRLVSGGLRIRM